MKNGLLIGFMGLPGSGKTTLAKNLAIALADGEVFCEPEETGWTDAVFDRDRSGYFTAISWFRSERVPQLYKANAVKLEGKIGIVDSYYDKLISKYLDDERMKWLIPHDDPYFELTREMGRIDYKQLPELDILFFLVMKESDWQELLKRRGRKLDEEKEFLESFPTQAMFLESCRAYAEEKDVMFLEIPQSVDEIESVVSDIVDVIVNFRDQ